MSDARRLPESPGVDGLEMGLPSLIGYYNLGLGLLVG
jgi:hypothetical protein